MELTLTKGLKQKLMSVSALPNYFTEDRKLLIVRDSLAKDEISLMTLPNTFQSVSCISLNEMIRNFDRDTTPIPDAILVNLNSVPTSIIIPIIKELKNHQVLNQIPVIGLKGSYLPNEKVAFQQHGFSDCICTPIDWQSLEERVRFLNKYKQKLSNGISYPTSDQAYKMPLGKRIFDIVIASSLLLGLSPVLLLVAILIKLGSKGGVFYTAKRVGTGYQIFDFIKFRSMEMGADTSLQDLNNSYAKEEEVTEDCTFFKIKDDPRVTKFGKFIRKTSIDELPQLFNVLKGEMSIVGNRPLPLYEAQKLTCDDWAKRFMAPAGLTGLWQVDERGKDNLKSEERIKLDMNYADNYSFLMDLKILMKTLPAMLQRD